MFLGRFFGLIGYFYAINSAYASLADWNYYW